MLNVRVLLVLVLASAAGLFGCVSRTPVLPGGQLGEPVSLPSDDAKLIDSLLQEEGMISSKTGHCDFWRRQADTSGHHAVMDYGEGGRTRFAAQERDAWCAVARDEEATEARAKAARDKAKKETAAEAKKREPERKVNAAAEAAADAERVKQVVAEEVRTGHCDPVVAKDFLGFVTDIGAKFDHMQGESWIRVDSRVLVLTDKPKELMTVLGRGEDHVFGLALTPMQLHVVDSDGNEVQRVSIYQEMVSSHLVSRQYRATGRPFTVSATGTGCALVIVMRKL